MSSTRTAHPIISPTVISGYCDLSRLRPPAKDNNDREECVVHRVNYDGWQNRFCPCAHYREHKAEQDEAGDCDPRPGVLQDVNARKEQSNGYYRSRRTYSAPQ